MGLVVAGGRRWFFFLLLGSGVLVGEGPLKYHIPSEDILIALRWKGLQMLRE